MRGWLSIVGLVLVLAVVGFLFKKQTSVLRAAPPLPASLQTPESGAPPQQGPAQIQQQYKKALEDALQQPRPMPDDVK